MKVYHVCGGQCIRFELFVSFLVSVCLTLLTPFYKILQEYPLSLIYTYTFLVYCLFIPMFVLHMSFKAVNEKYENQCI